MSSNPRALRRFRTACECAVRTLSHPPRLGSRLILHLAYSCALCQDVFRSTLEFVKKSFGALRSINPAFTKLFLSGVLLVFPKLVSDYFNANRSSPSRWERVTTTSVRLFRTTTPYQLFDESLRVEIDPSPEAMESNSGRCTHLLFWHSLYSDFV